MALRLSGLQKAKHGAQPLPDGAGAYPAYERLSPVRNLCRMALRLSGLQTAKPGA